MRTMIKQVAKIERTQVIGWCKKHEARLIAFTDRSNERKTYDKQTLSKFGYWCIGEVPAVGQLVKLGIKEVTPQVCGKCGTYYSARIEKM